MRGSSGEAVLFGTANSENEADGAESARPKGKKRRLKRDGKKTRRFYEYVRLDAFGGPLGFPRPSDEHNRLPPKAAPLDLGPEFADGPP
jgi:hypothetical protein